MTIPPYALITGQQHPNWTPPPHDGVQVHFTGNIALLRLCFADPSPSEIQAFATNPIEIGLMRYSDTLFFFLARVRDCTDGWTDCPFALGRLDAESQVPMRRERHEGLALNTCLVDRNDGIIKSLRTVSMTPHFCNELEGKLAEQREALALFNEQRYALEIANAYRMWSHPDEMAKDAVIVERAGIAFA